MRNLGQEAPSAPILHLMGPEDRPGVPSAPAATQRLSNTELIERYASSCRRRNLSAGSISAWTSRLRQLSASVRKSFFDLTRQDVERFLDSRGDLASETCRFWLTCLNSFYRWAIAEELLEDNPVARIPAPKIKKRSPRPIPDDELARAVAQADPVTRCFLLLGAYQGLRCLEMAGLNRDDVVEEKGILRVVGKGNKERLLPLHPEVLAALRALPMPASGAIFRRRRMLDRYPAYAVSQEINSYLHSIGIASGAHSLRHWFASSMYRSTKDLRLTQELLGHSSPETTAIYAAFDTSKAGPAVRGLTIGARQCPR